MQRFKWFLNERFRSLHCLAFRHKIVLISLCCITVPTVFLGLVSHRIAGEIIRTNTLKQTELAAQRSAQHLDEQIRSIVRNLNSFLGTDNVESILIRAISDPIADMPELFRRLQPFIANFRLNNQLVDSMYLYTPNQVFFDASKHYNISPSRESYVAYFEKYAMMLEFSSVRFIATPDYSSLLNPSGRSIAIVVAPYLPGVPRKSTIAVIVLNSRVLRRYLIYGDIPAHFSSSIVDADEDIVVSTPAEADSGGSASSETYTIQATVGFPSWTLRSFISRRELLRQTNYIRTVTLIVIAVSGAVSILISIAFAHTVTRPLEGLHGVMDKVRQGDFHVRYTVEHEDEIGNMGHALNRMLNEMERSLHELRHEKARVQREQRLTHVAELKALQAQINPHFLYNALNSLYWRCSTSGDNGAAELAISLSEFFRVGLADGRQEVPVRDEMSLVDHYLSVQREVYKNRFTYRIEIDPDTRECAIIKFIVQPLVENSLVHGFSDMSLGAEIVIRSFFRDDTLHLEVADNGRGFDATVIRDLLRKRNGLSSAYALSNIRDRLNLRYGSSYHFEFDSDGHSGSVVSIVLPVVHRRWNEPARTVAWT